MLLLSPYILHCFSLKLLFNHHPKFIPACNNLKELKELKEHNINTNVRRETLLSDD
jgi:hypothetical protein